MFNKLIVSKNERRGKRTARIFLGTAIIYLTAVAFAFALSILVANPRMADARETIFLAPPNPLVVDKSIDGTATHHGKVGRTQNLNNAQDLEHIMSKPQNTAWQIPPGVNGPVDRSGWDEASRNDGGDVPEDIGKGLGISQSGDNEDAPAPKPPDTRKPIAQTRPDDNRQPLKLTSPVLQGKATVRRLPDYPPLAKQIHLEDSVSVEIIIGTDGHVESARAVSGHPLLVTAAVSAAHGWRFEPTLLNGMPVRVTGIIVFNFKLN